MAAEHADRGPVEVEEAPQAVAAAPASAPAVPLSGPLDAARVLALQRSAGNQAVARALAARAAPPPPAPPRLSTVAGPVVARLEASGHERAERAALTGGPGGFSDSEASAVYFGNWSRDLSQALLNHPIIRTLGQEVVFELINLIAMQKFGRELDKKDFGVYSPRQHIDNPAGQVSGDLSQPGDKDAGDHHLDKPEELPTSKEELAKLFTVDEHGLPAYLGRSIQYIEEELSIAADEGRTQSQGPVDHKGRKGNGLEHMGNALHTVEDLFAHSNFVEIAVGGLLNSGDITVSAETQADLAKRKQEGLDPVETLSGKTEKGRPILTTGSYVASDTLVSLSEAVTSFFDEFDPFAATNKERSQKTTEMLLKRYQGTGRAGEVVGSMLRSMAANIPAKLREWVTSKLDPAEPDKPMNALEKAAFEAKKLAAGVAGKALDVVADLAGTDWIQKAAVGAANAASSLPWTEIYHFAAKQKNRIEEDLKALDAQLLASPISKWAYEPFRAWLMGHLEAMREAAKAAIKTALKAASDLIKKGFGEGKAETSNISAQIDDAVNNQIKNAKARAEFNGLKDPEAKAKLLSDPKWCAEARITASDAEHLKGMILLPEWAQKGPSHSQIGKDHADSPFYGAVIALAAHADRRIRDLLIAVWQGEGKNTQQADLAKDYGSEIPEDIRRKLADPNLDPKERAALERKAQKAAYDYKDIKRREEGEKLLAEGGNKEAEEDHPGDDALEAGVHGLHGLAKLTGGLPDDLRRLADRVQVAAPQAAAELRAVAAALPAGLDELAEEAEHAADAPAMRRVADRLRAVAREKEGLVARAQGAAEAAATAIAAAQPAGEAAAEDLRRAAKQVGVVAPKLAQALTTAAEALAKAAVTQSVTDKQMKDAREVKVTTGKWDAELSASHAKGGTPDRDALFKFVREVFSHPSDSTWWRAPLIAWSKLPGNQERLEAYIKVRNSGKIHHHH